MQSCFQFLVFILSYMLCLQGFADSSTSPNCLAQGASDALVDNDVAKINGGDTGLFYREVFAENNIRKISSCLEVTPMSKKKLKLFFAKKSDGKEDQLPYHYFGVRIGSQEFEAGVFYDSPTGQLKAFTSNFAGKRITYLSTPIFLLSDRICLGLEYDRASQLLKFSLRKGLKTSNEIRKNLLENDSSNSDVVATELVKFKQSDSIQFKRVTSLALRSLPQSSQASTKRANGGLTSKRLSILRKAGLRWNVLWNSSHLIGYDGKITTIDPKNYIFSSPKGRCVGTSLWPSSAVRIDSNKKNETRVQFF